MRRQRLDRADEFYYIVPVQRGSEAPGSYVAVDARFGNYMQSVSVPTQGGLEILNRDRQGLARRLLEQGVITAPCECDPIVIRPAAFCQYPALVL